MSEAIENQGTEAVTPPPAAAELTDGSALKKYLSKNYPLEAAMAAAAAEKEIEGLSPDYRHIAEHYILQLRYPPQEALKVARAQESIDRLPRPSREVADMYLRRGQGIQSAARNAAAHQEVEKLPVNLKEYVSNRVKAGYSHEHALAMITDMPR